MTTYLGKGYSFGLMCVSFVNVYQSLCFSFPLGFECGMWDLAVWIPGHCLSIYFTKFLHMVKQTRQNN